jgi:two-component system sensor histidine kinase QseC
MNPSIRNRLLVSLLAATLAVWLITALKNYYDTKYEVEQLFDAQLAQSADALLTLSAHELYEQLAYLGKDRAEGQSIPEQVTEHQHKYGQRVAFQIWTANNRLAVRSKSAPRLPLSNVENVFVDRLIDGQLWRVYAISNPAKTVQVQVGEQHARRDQLSKDIAWHLLTSVIVSLPLLALLIWAGVRRAMEPLHRVANDVQSREFDNLQHIASKRVPLEAKPLVDALNELFDRLQVAFDNIRRFTADAAHELRTPLAALKTNAQVAYRADDEPTRKEALAQVMEGVDRSTRLVEQLLTLARLDPDASTVLRERTDLCNLCEDTLAGIAPEALRKNIDLTLHPCQDKNVIGSSGMLGILLRNLVENAIRYTPDGGKVEVGITSLGNETVLTVADSGPGIPQAERKQVFKRFYRRVGSTVPGTGLGLSIVHRIAEIHKARIELGESIYDGLKVEVHLQSDVTAKPEAADKLAAQRACRT